MHDGRASTLDQVLRLHHRAIDLNGYKLSDSDRENLVAYLKSL